MEHEEQLEHNAACDMIDEIFDCAHGITEWEENFLTNVFNSVYPTLTIKQTKVLYDIYEKRMK